MRLAKGPTHWWFAPRREPPNYQGGWLEVMLWDGTVCLAHYARDLSGEEQPPFEGWFVEVKDSRGKSLYYREVHPMFYRRIQSLTGASNE